ncbi:hypothetical protein F4553_003215 [Allocatelliglobosispora scoriae]|uniref:ABM domain-containing protein n=1 Tax=Allocatelliglobosispora scoriae TaxID=643052 RepID=A0A841BR48_9ACTN|nr:hypothetical protein [Allocatelliglobosispora scoriae]MBB5869836.1 hypothetical protein [Allocatelliglobosispora scoriae]
MPFAVMQEMPNVSEGEYRLVEQHLGPDRPPGLLAHVSGPSEEGWRIINVWENEAAFRRFQSERLMRAAGLAAQGDGFDASKAAGFRSYTVDGAEMPF